jgi:acyl-coenzyme A thioesterase PaaI-like protein
MWTTRRRHLDDGLTVHFLRPVRPARVFGRGRVVHRVADLAHLEATLHDGDDEIIATATATARVTPSARPGTPPDRPPHRPSRRQN